ncbi:MAG: sugar-binding protein [Bacteroidota bacterium]
MRKIYKFLLLGLFVALPLTSFGQGVGVTMTATAPTIDGDVGDAAWAAATPLDIANVSSGTMDDAFAASFRMLWDADYLYVAISVDDDTLTNTNGPSVFSQDQNDYIDIYIDMDRRYPYTYVNPFGDGPGYWEDPALGKWNGSWWNLFDENDFQVQLLRDADFLAIGGQFPGQAIDSAASGITIGQLELAGGYTYEMAIPFDNLIEGGFDAVHNARLGFEIAVGDADTKGAADTLRDGRVAWNMEAGVDYAWGDPELWGVIVLDDGSGVSLPAANPAVELAAAAPAIDGTADAMWTDVPFREIRNTSSGLMDQSFGADYKVLWDANNLYLLVDIKDDTLTNTNTPSGLAQDQNDFIDIYVDMDRLYPYTYINPFGDGPGYWVDAGKGEWNGSWWNLYDENDYQVQLLRDADFLGIGGQFPGRTVDGSASGIVYGQTEKADGSGWMMEVQIPFANLDAGFVADHNTRLGFEIVVGDADTQGTTDTLRDGRVAWHMPAGVDVAWADPEEWGVLVLSDGSAISAPATNTEIMQTATAPVIDGTIDDLWGSVEFREIRNTTDGAMDSLFAAEFKTVWDATNLYLLVEVQDEELKNINTPSGLAQDQNDYIDLYLDTDMKFPYFYVNPFGDGPGAWEDPALGKWNGSWWNYYDTTDFQIKFLRDAAFLEIGGQHPDNSVDSAASGITFAQAEVAGGWLLEVSIPWANMDPNFVPGHDTPFGLEVVVGDADADTIRNGRNSWFETVDRAWEQPLLWATAILSDGGEVTTKVLSLENDLLSTTIGVIDAENNAIIEIPKYTTATDLVAAVTVSAGATAEVYEKAAPVDGSTEIAETGMVLRIWSEKGLWNDVALALEVVPTGLFEDFQDALTSADSAIWFTNHEMHDDGSPVFDISVDTTLKYDMVQETYWDGIQWKVGMLNLQDNPRVSVNIKIEDATWEDKQNPADPVSVTSLPVQVSMFTPDGEGGFIRVGNNLIDVPAAALGAGTFETYYFDMSEGDAWISDNDSSFNLADTITWLLFETVKWNGVYDATIWIDDVAIGDQALEASLPSLTGYSEDFESEIDMDIWDANRGTHADETTRIFQVSGDNGALKVEMNQSSFADGELFKFTKDEWVLDMSDPANQVVSMKIKVEDATYDDGTGAVAIPTLPFQVSLMANVPDPDPGEYDPDYMTRVGVIQAYIPVAATGAGEFVEYYFDFAADIAADGHPHAPEKVMWAMLIETVQWPGTLIANYWMDDIRMGDEVIPYVPSDDATIHSTLYGTLGTGEITELDPALSVTAVLIGLTVQDSATVVMLDGSGGSEIADPDRTKVVSGMVVLVTAEDGTTMEYTISTTTGILTLNAEHITVYPNPAYDMLNISNAGAFERITVTSITGQTVEVLDVTSDNLTVDLSNYDAGVYFLSFEHAEYGSVIKKFIKK